MVYFREISSSFNFQNAEHRDGSAWGPKAAGPAGPTKKKAIVGIKN